MTFLKQRDFLDNDEKIFTVNIAIHYPKTVFLFSPLPFEHLRSFYNVDFNALDIIMVNRIRGGYMLDL